jgi:membrane protease YdiL (CAAX protease family)
MMLANVAVTQGVVAGLVVGAAWYFAIPADALGATLEPDGSTIALVGAGVGFGGLLWVANELATTVADAVGAAYDEALRELLAPETTGGWLLLYGGVLPIIALSEELLFRAALIGVPAAGYGLSPVVLAVVSSVAFALGHGAQGRVGVVVTGALGLVLAGAYVVSGSLLLVVVAHYVVNMLEFLVHEHLGLGQVFSV